MFKRVELPGSLLYDLFIEYYRLQQKIYIKILTKNTHLKEVFILITLQVLLKTITESFSEKEL